MEDRDSEPIKNLLIIGNGFDLEAKLETRYDSFLKNNVEQVNWGDDFPEISSLEDLSKEIRKQIQRYNNAINHAYNSEIPIQELDSLMEIVAKSGMTIWEVLLIYESKQIRNWLDVESLIEEIVNTEKYDYIKQLTLLMKKQVLHESLASIRDKILDESILIFSFWAVTAGLRSEQFEKASTDYIYYDEFSNEILTWLNDQLDSFQARFKEHMNSLLPSEPDDNPAINGYTFEIAQIFDRILKDFDGEYMNLLNFNYTQPDTYYAQYKQKRATVPGEIRTIYAKNVHGTIKNVDKPIIFGIDNTNIKEDTDEVHFTKAFKTLNVPTGYFFQNDADDLVNTQVKNITFFGHSLGRADYGYFYRVFDQVHLLESEDVKLNFYYNDSFIKEESEDKEKLEKKKILDAQMLAVLRLLESYAIRTRKNELSAKTVLLELQSRIKIIKY